MFMIIKTMNKIRKEVPPEAAAPSSEALLTDILSELRKK